MDLVVLDLEWNGSYSRNLRGYINEIIEFGAVKCDNDMKEIDRFSCFVKPQVGKKLNAVISNLTSITDENLSDGLTFMQAVSRFKKWCGDCVILTWGTSDILALIENCRYFNGNGVVPFLQRYCDIQKYVQLRMGNVNKGMQIGLLAAAQNLEIDTAKLEMHRALDDSLLSCRILRRLYDKKKMQDASEECNDEFYKRITFKTSYINDILSPLVKESYLQLSCPKCGGGGEIEGKWGIKNKGLRATFVCSECRHTFGGSVIIKQKYEGIKVSKKTFSIAQIEVPRKAENQKIGNMSLDIVDGVGLLHFDAFRDIKGINHAFSTRIGGVSDDEFAAMNLGFGRGDADKNVEENYKIICEAGGFNKDTLIAGAQDHHVNVRRVGTDQAGIGIWKPKDMTSVDGLCTNDPDVSLVIYCADCVPLYFVDLKNRAIALSHAGWRGTVMDMAGETVRRMVQEFGTRPADLRVAIGPSIGSECFEVDGPVAKEFLDLKDSQAFVESRWNGKYHVDLWECNRLFLIEAGVAEDNIIVGGVCTMCESDLVFSHRKTKGKRGSNAAFLSLADY